MGAKDLAFDIRSRKQLNRRIDCLRYTLTSFSVTTTIAGIVIFAYCIWMKVDPKFYEWIDYLHVHELYIGVYIILFGSIIIIIGSFVTCLFVLTDNALGLKVMAGVDGLIYLFCVIGSAVLMNYSSRFSVTEVKIKRSMLDLIAQPAYARGHEILRAIQESMGCCGANGANDYLTLNQALLPECRDSVTGSAYLYSCPEKLTTFLSEKSGWLTGLTLLVAALIVIQAVLKLILIKALDMEVAPITPYQKKQVETWQ